MSERLYVLTLSVRVAGGRRPETAMIELMRTITGSESCDPYTLGQLLVEQIGPCEISGHEVGSGFSQHFGGFQ